MSRSIGQIEEDAKKAAAELNVVPGQWPWSGVVHHLRQARYQGAPLEKVLSWVGLEETVTVDRPEAAANLDPEAKPIVDELIELWGINKGQHRDEATDLQLRDLTEQALDAGVGMTPLARMLRVSRGTVRNLMHPGYGGQTPAERAAYRAERKQVRAARKDLLG